MIYSLIDVPIEASAGRDTGGEHALITLSEETEESISTSRRAASTKRLPR